MVASTYPARPHPTPPDPTSVGILPTVHRPLAPYVFLNRNHKLASRFPTLCKRKPSLVAQQPRSKHSLPLCKPKPSLVAQQPPCDQQLGIRLYVCETSTIYVRLSQGSSIPSHRVSTRTQWSAAKPRNIESYARGAHSIEYSTTEAALALALAGSQT